MDNEINDGLFADCREGNHAECLYQWPNAYASVDENQQEYVMTCTCDCHDTPKGAKLNDEHDY